jgi:hypothetical protein
MVVPQYSYQSCAYSWKNVTMLHVVAVLSIMFCIMHQVCLVSAPQSTCFRQGLLTHDVAACLAARCCSGWHFALPAMAAEPLRHHVCAVHGCASVPVCLCTLEQLVLLRNGWWQYSVVSRILRVYRRSHVGAMAGWLRGDTAASGVRRPVAEYLRQVDQREDAETSHKQAKLSMAQAATRQGTWHAARCKLQATRRQQDADIQAVFRMTTLHCWGLRTLVVCVPCCHCGIGDRSKYWYWC